MTDVPKHVEVVKDHKFMYICNMCTDLGLEMGVQQTAGNDIFTMAL